MILFLFIILSIVWFSYWSAESGRSLPWSDWQDLYGFLSGVPEKIIALSVAYISIHGWGEIFEISKVIKYVLYAISTGVVLAGKEAATFALLIWRTHIPKNFDREYTLRPINDWIASKFGWKYGDEGYSWVVAATKGFLMTAPIGGTGLIFNPLGHELGSHAKNRLKGDPNMWKELSAGGLGIGVPVIFFLLFINYVSQ